MATYAVKDAYKYKDDSGKLISLEFVCEVTAGNDVETEAVVLNGAAINGTNLAALKNLAEIACAKAEKRIDDRVAKRIAIDTSGVSLNATNIANIKATL